MKCSTCNTENPDEFEFCMECGTKLDELICSSCGHSNKSNHSFCINCGTSLAEQGSESKPKPKTKKSPVIPASNSKKLPEVQSKASPVPKWIWGFGALALVLVILFAIPNLGIGSPPEEAVPPAEEVFEEEPPELSAAQSSSSQDSSSDKEETGKDEETSSQSNVLYDSRIDGWEDWEEVGPSDTYIVEKPGDSLLLELPQKEDRIELIQNDDLGFNDVRIDAKVQLVGGPDYTVFGLSCRQSEAGSYEVQLDTGGWWGILKYDSATGWEVIDSGKSKAINKSREENTMTLICNGDLITYLINGKKISEFHDSLSQSGRIGVALDTYDSPGSRALFKELIVTMPSVESKLAIESAEGDGNPTFTADQDTNCRYGPSSSDFDIRETIFEGETVSILGVGKAPFSEWWLVEVNGKECWVWSGLGEANGDTADLASINPPPIPVAEQPVTEPDDDQDADQEEDTADTEEDPRAICDQLNPVVIVDPWMGTHPVSFTFYVSGFPPGDQLFFHIHYPTGDGDENYVTYYDKQFADGDGESTFGVNSDEFFDSLDKGTYIVYVDSGLCSPDTDDWRSDAAFILE